MLDVFDLRNRQAPKAPRLCRSAGSQIDERHLANMIPENGKRASLEKLERRQLLSAGDLDSTFGVGGRVETPLHNANAEFEDAILLSDD
jgi:hypothetical protein